MKIFITGAAGFIGAHTCKVLIEAGHELIAVDSYSDYYSTDLKKKRVEALLNPQDLTIHEVDISDLEQIYNLLKKYKPEAVINFAAQAGVRLKIEQNKKYVLSNLTGFTNILNSSVMLEIPYFLYASSSSVYGNNAKVPYSENESNLEPTSFYGATKLCNEILTPALVHSSSTAARGVRFFSVYGPWGRPDMAYFRMISNGLIGSPFNFFGDGNFERDFTFIDDVTISIKSLIENLITQPNGFHDIVNLGGGRPLSMNYLLNQVSSILDKKIEFKREITNVYDVKQTVADSSYLKSLIGSKPEIRIEEGLQRTIEWARQEKITRDLSEWVSSVT